MGPGGSPADVDALAFLGGANDDYLCARNDYGPTALHLAEAHSSAVDTSYQGASGDELAVRGWAGGYEYEVRFLGNGAPRPISSPEHALVPVDASVGVRPAGCAACLYATGFPSFGTVYVRGRAVNALGPGPWSDVAEATPQRVPDAVGSFSLEVLSGSEIRVFWSPPPTASAPRSPLVASEP